MNNLGSYPPMAPPLSGNRKMRRTRDASTSASSAVDGNGTDVPGSVGNSLDGYDIYNIHGDAIEALKVFQQRQQQSKNLSKDDDGAGVGKSDTTGMSIASKYNCMMLSQIASNKKKRSQATPTGVTSTSASWRSIFMNKLDEIEAQYLQEQDRDDINPLVSASSLMKKRRNEFILSYNRMLGLFGSGDIRQCAIIFTKKLSSSIEKYRAKAAKRSSNISNSNSSTVSKKVPTVSSSVTTTTAVATTTTTTNGSSIDDKKKVTKLDRNFPTEVAAVAVRMAFLIFECVLTMCVGRNSSLNDIASTIGIPLVGDIVDWLESLPVIHSGNSNLGTTGSLGIDNSKDAQQLRFLFNLYKSRLALADLHAESGTYVDANLRCARKDMKTAMEIFQHKLRPTYGSSGNSSNAVETGSVVSSANSEENLSMAGGSNHQLRHHHHENMTLSSNVVLQKLNQSALGLKAHLEQLKGNTKKSLILCSEAVGSVDEGMGSYEAIHSNNLAVIYETNERRHLALHTLAKSLRASSVDMGGTSISTDDDDESTNDKFRNSSTQPAAESSVPLFYRDGTVRTNFMTSLAILHNAAICALRARNYISAYECFATCISRSEIFSNRPAVWLRMSEACFGIWSSIKKSRTASSFGHGVKGLHVDGGYKGLLLENAAFSDDETIIIEEPESVLASSEDMAQVRRSPLVRARVCIEIALQSESKLNHTQLIASRLGLAFIYLSFGYHQRALDMCQLIFGMSSPLFGDDTITSRLYRRQLATARLYASEAACALGQPGKSMLYLTVGSLDESDLDGLVRSLSGVSLDATSDKAKRQLERAQSIVRSLTVVLSSNSNDTYSQSARQLVAKVRSEEEWHSMDIEKSSACLALVYSLLRAGEQSPALGLLMSMGSL